MIPEPELHAMRKRIDDNIHRYQNTMLRTDYAKELIDLYTETHYRRSETHQRSAAGTGPAPGMLPNLGEQNFSLRNDTYSVGAMARDLLQSGWDFKDRRERMKKPPEAVEDFLHSCEYDSYLWSEFESKHEPRAKFLGMVLESYHDAYRQQRGRS